MRKTPDRQSTAEASTLADRVAAAFGSMLFSVPLMGLFWLLFNSQVAVISDSAIPASYLAAAVVAFSIFSFAFPRFTPTVCGWLCDLFLGIAKWW